MREIRHHRIVIDNRTGIHNNTVSKTRIGAYHSHGHNGTTTPNFSLRANPSSRVHHTPKRDLCSSERLLPALTQRIVAHGRDPGIDLAGQGGHRLQIADYRNARRLRQLRPAIIHEQHTQPITG